MLNNADLLTIALASAPVTVAVVVGILVNNALLDDLRNHLDVRFAEMKDRWRSQDLERS
jgi:hypothetical protein